MDLICHKIDCCDIQIHQYKPIKGLKPYERKRKRKAGVFIFDSKNNKVLLIQSKGNLWGPPKGSIKPDEDAKTCAIREVKEETGLDINIEDLTKFIIIRGKATYFFVEKEKCFVQAQNHIIYNDANSIAWFDIECLKRFIKNKNISITHHCRVVFEQFLNIKFN